MIIQREDYSPSAGVLEALENIFSAVLIGGMNKDTSRDQMNMKVEVYKQTLPLFKNLFKHNIFMDEYAIFYSIIVDNKVESFSYDMLASFLVENTDIILRSENVNKSDYAMGANGEIADENEVAIAIINDVLDRFRHLSDRLVSLEQFNSSCKYYVQWFKNRCMTRISLNMATIMNDQGFLYKSPGERSRLYKGCDDAQLYYARCIEVLKSLDDKDRVTSSVINLDWAKDQQREDDKGGDSKELFDTGIAEIDNSMGKLRRGYVLGVLGPPKGGKTRFTNFLVGRALEEGLNVAVWPLEGSRDEWEAMQIAYYMARAQFKRSKGSLDNVGLVPSDMILHRKYLRNPELAKQVNAARMVLAGTDINTEIDAKSVKGARGKLSFIEGTAYIEDYLDIIQNHYNYTNRFDVFVMDSPVNIMSRRGKGKVERISEAYMDLKNFLANQLNVPALGIFPAQLKQDVVDMKRKNPDAEIDVTAGGESAETIRTPDEVIGLFSDKAERKANIMSIYSVATRHSSDFDNFRCTCYLGSCYFMSNDKA